MVSFVDKSFFVSLSKALGCKRVHDDRIAGVTFEENASHNALIVNEEYAWVGNPFSAPKQKGEPLKGSPFCFAYRCMRDSAHVTSKHPSRGRGCLPKFAESLVRSASTSPVFRSPGQKGGVSRNLTKS